MDRRDSQFRLLYIFGYFGYYIFPRYRIYNISVLGMALLTRAWRSNSVSIPRLSKYHSDFLVMCRKPKSQRRDENCTAQLPIVRSPAAGLLWVHGITVHVMISSKMCLKFIDLFIFRLCQNWGLVRFDQSFHNDPGLLLFDLHISKSTLYV